MEDKSDTNNNDPVDADSDPPPPSRPVRSKLSGATSSAAAGSDNYCDSSEQQAADGGGGGELSARVSTTGTAELGGEGEEDVSSSHERPSSSGTSCSPLGRKSDSAAALNHSATRKCYYCGKRFTKLGDFRQHLVSHLGKKAFKCRDCGRRFRVKSNLLFHQQAAHGPANQLALPSLVSPDYVSSLSEHSAHLSFVRPLSDSAMSETPAKMAADSGGESSTKSSPADGAGSAEGQAAAAASKKLGTNGFSPHSSTGSGGSLERELSYSDEFVMEYPSQFPGLKHQISIKNETVVITRLDGTNVSTGEKTSLYKCHLCGKVFNFLSRLQCHLSLHFERHMTLYQCTYCDAHFKFKTLLLQHLRTGHGVHVSSRSDIPDSGPMSPQEFDENPGEEQSLEAGEGGSGLPKSASSSSSAALAALREGSAGGGYAGDRDPGSEGQDTQGGERPGSGNEDSLGSEDFLSSNGGQYYTAGYGGKPLYDKVNGLYICQFCNKSFDRLFSLHRHERVHTGYKPCYCTYCGRGFSEPRNLRHHMIRFHSDGSQIHLIKRMRKKPTVDSGLSRTSQRLPLVTPEMIARAAQQDLPAGRPDSAPARAEPRPERSHSDARGELRGAEPPAPHPSRSPIIVEPRGGGGSAGGFGEPPAKRLASEIREQERLDEDVTVVIPTDGPIEHKERNMQTPKSTMSDNTSWSGNLSEGDVDTSPGGEIISAPVKSIMGQYSSLRTSKRKHSTPTQPSPPRGESARDEEYRRGEGRGTPRSAASDDAMEERDSKPDMSALTSAHHHFLGAVSATASDLKYHPTSTPMSLPFSPLSISTFVNPGLAGLMPSPMMSPLGQAALFGQHGLTSPNMVGNPLSFFPPLPSAVALSQSAAAAATTTSCTSTTKESTSSSSSTVASPGLAEMEDYPSWMAKGGSRGSSLSRTHSRLYVVNKPVKREDVCKPTVLPDGRTVYRCSYCNKDFCTFSDVNRHMDFHEDIRPYKCKFCDYYARTNSQLKVHMMRHQGIREFHCKLCNYKGVTQSDLNRHMKSQIHMMKARNECKHCGEGFVSPMNLEKHYHEKHFSQFEQLANQAGTSK